MLRSSALGEALPLEARSGLIVFLRQGMWAWAKALRAQASPCCVETIPIYSPTATELFHSSQSAVIHILAAIAMGTNDRRPA